MSPVAVGGAGGGLETALRMTFSAGLGTIALMVPLRQHGRGQPKVRANPK